MIYYFRYEQGPTGQWGPVLYHDGPPTNREQRAATALVAYDTPDEPSFKMMTTLFPLERYLEVVRPVEGFQTKDGKFFEDKTSADVHETTYSLTRAFYEYVAVDAPMMAGLSDEIKDEIVQRALQFLHDNRKDVIGYLEATERTTDTSPDTTISPDRPNDEAAA